jgi:heme A synthase
VNELEFYSAAAQVIPLLFLVIVFEVRFWERGSYRDAGRSWVRLTARAFDVLVLLLIVAGEWAALRVLDTGSAGEWSHRLVVNALLLEGLVIVWFTWRVGGRGRLDTAETITQFVAALDERRATIASSKAEESPSTEPDDPPTRREAARLRPS